MEHFVPFVIETCEMEGSSNNEGYPLVPDLERPFHSFRIQDPFGLRNAVVPVFRQDVTGSIYGLGTAFNINEFGTFLTAHHVIDFIEYDKNSRPILFLGMHGLVYGKAIMNWLNDFGHLNRALRWRPNPRCYGHAYFLLERIQTQSSGHGAGRGTIGP